MLSGSLAIREPETAAHCNANPRRREAVSRWRSQIVMAAGNELSGGLIGSDGPALLGPFRRCRASAAPSRTLKIEV